MKKILLINLAVIMVFLSLLCISCKKTVHPTHPTPANNRLLSYTKFSTSTIIGAPAINENFRFYYDGSQKLIQIVYSSNDSTSKYNPAGDLSEKIINFTYTNDTIYKTIKSTRSGLIFEIDTFIQNSYGFITQAFTAGEMNSYGYFGKLITNTGKSSYDSGTTIYATSTYTSDNGDLLNRAYDGTLHASFPDSGLIDVGGGLLQRAYLYAPLNVYWTDLQTGKVTTHKLVPGYSDVFTGYTMGDSIAIRVTDTATVNPNVVAFDTLIWAGGIWPRESFYVYPDLDNRTGDYLQIESYTMYGSNIYQNAHLVRQIVEQNGPTTNVTYTIDADSKITQTYVTKTDRYFNKFTTVYKFQYATY